MARQFYSRDHYRRLAGYPDPPEQAAALAAERMRQNRIRDQIQKEREERYAGLDGSDPEKVKEALAWLEQRWKELEAEL